MSGILNSKTNTAVLKPGLNLFSEITDFSNRSKTNISEKLKNLKNVNFPKLPKIKGFKPAYLIIAVIVLVVIAGGYLLLKPSGESSEKNADQIVTANGKTATISKKINFPIKDQSGKETGNNLVVNFTTIERAEKIIYKGRPLLPKEGKDFIVINLEVENSTKDRLNIRPVDFVRLIEGERSFAPDIQTEPVKVEPDSIKKTRIIFVIGDNQNNLKFLIGELKGNRETVEVKI